MANWSELIKEIGQLGSPFDILRLKYISALAKYTRRNVICYYSGWLQKPELGIAAAVNDTDKNGLMTTINGLDVSKASTWSCIHQVVTLLQPSHGLSLE